MSEVHFEIADDVVIKRMPMLGTGEEICKVDIVITKEIFQECYKMWIEPQEKENKE